jgi:hypothetical protein
LHFCNARDDGEVTDAAPAARSARAQPSAVAPVVRTSSISSTMPADHPVTGAIRAR